MKIITEKLQNLWNSDEVKVLVLTSLGVQVALQFLAPLRKRISNIMLSLTLLLLYLTADYVATLGLGNIISQTLTGSGVSSELTILWAPFLLVHLGGPDTITSYSIEDNELWRRHLLGLLFQVTFTVFIFIQSPPTGWLWIPTIFVFILGLIKFAERTHAFRLASKDYLYDKFSSELHHENRTMTVSWDNTLLNASQANETTKGCWGNLMGNMGNLMGSIKSVLFPPEDTIVSKENPPSHAGQANETTIVSNDNTPSNAGQANKTPKGFCGLMGSILSVLFPQEDTIDNLDPPFPDISKNKSAAILEGFRWFKIYKRLLVDVPLSADLLMKSQDRFSDLSTTEALDLVAIELSFLYGYLHTKAVNVHSILGRALSYFSLVSIIAAFVVFHHLDMQKYVFVDIIITYILFGVALSLEVLDTILPVFTDWTVVAFKRMEHGQCVADCITRFVKLILKKGTQRWACTIGHFNLVDFSLRDEDTVLAKIMRILKIKNKWDNMREKKLNPLLSGLLEEIMVTEAKRRAPNVHIYKVLVEARSFRGNKTLERHNQLEKLEWSMKREFDESIILWHLATDICYYEDETSNKPNPQKQEPSHPPNGENQEPSHPPNGENQEPSDPPINGTFGLKSCSFGTSKQPNGEKDTERDVSWKTSNYMIYLLTQQQSMMHLLYGKKQIEAICAVIKNKFKGKEKLDPWTVRDVLKKNEGATQVSEQNNASVLKKWANLRCWGRRKWEEDKRKDEETTQVSEENNAPVSADSSQPTNKMVTSVLKKIWANLRRCTPPVLKNWGRRKREEAKHKRKNEETKQVSEEINTTVSADSSQPTNKMVTSVLKKIWANLRRCTPPVLKNWGRRKREEAKRKRKDEDDMGQSILRDSCQLAKELQELKPEIKWKLISETWMEMLGYAAIHCDSYQHAKSLSRGGELLTHLWLLMSQLGVVDEHRMPQFQSGYV